jgi:glycosyltransferase involved in cell wall biosynthesis
VASDVCWHTVEVAAFDLGPTARSVDPVVVVLGTVYSVNVDEFRRLCRVVGQLRQGAHPSLSVRLHTTQTEEQLKAEGVPRRPWLTVSSLMPADVPSALAEATVLFLGLAFEEQWRRVDEIAFPTKLAEYLAAGRPILVHAPSYSTAVSYARQREVALVVDQPDDEALSVGLETLITDRVLAEKLGVRGREVARANHDRSQMVANFLRTIEACTSVVDRRMSKKRRGHD